MVEVRYINWGTGKVTWLEYGSREEVLSMLEREGYDHLENELTDFWIKGEGQNRIQANVFDAD